MIKFHKERRIPAGINGAKKGITLWKSNKYYQKKNVENANMRKG